MEFPCLDIPLVHYNFNFSSMNFIDKKHDDMSIYAKIGMLLLPSTIYYNWSQIYY